MEYEVIHEEDRDGWHIEVALAPDYDYRPGEDDDIYPVFEDAGRYLREYGRDEAPRDYDGHFLPRPIIVDSRQGPLMVTTDEIRRLIEVRGMDPRTARKNIESDARAIAGELLIWAIVRVRATAPSGVTGEDYLGGVEYDLRQRTPEQYALEVADEMVGEAIENAARSVLGGNAALALSY